MSEVDLYGLHFHHVIYISYFIAGMGAVDFFIARKMEGRWLLLHALANLVVTIFCLQDFYLAVLDPVNSCNSHSYSLIPVYGIAALHLYHLIAFRNLSTSDWVHHLVFGGIICPVGICFRSGPLLSMAAFFICGLPGGLDYLMLFLVKQGKLDRLTEKGMNTRINVWLRSPGLMFTVVFIYIASKYGAEDSLCRKNYVIAGFMAVLFFLNGQYYMQVVALNTARKVRTYSS